MEQLGRIAAAVGTIRQDLGPDGRDAMTVLVRELELLARHLDTGEERPCSESLSRLHIALRLMDDPDTDVLALVDQWGKGVRERNAIGALQ